MSEAYVLYLKNINSALSRYDVEVLVRIWYDAVYLGPEGTVLRTVILEAIPNLAEHYGIEYDEYTTFPELVKEYDLKQYSKFCNKPPDDCLEIFAERGDWRNIKIAIEKGARKWNKGMFGAACPARSRVTVADAGKTQGSCRVFHREGS